MASTFLKNDEPGSLSDIYEIKILICYLLSCIEQPLSKEQVNYVFQFNSIVNYFSFCQALKELIDTHHIEEIFSVEDGKKILQLMPMGKNTASTLSGILQKSTRDKIISTAKQVLVSEQQERDHQVSVTKVEDGYMVHLVIHDIGSDLLEMTLFAPDKQAAQQMAERFNQDAVILYRGMLGILQNDSMSIHQIADEIAKQNKST